MRAANNKIKHDFTKKLKKLLLEYGTSTELEAEPDEELQYSKRFRLILSGYADKYFEIDLGYSICAEGMKPIILIP